MCGFKLADAPRQYAWWHFQHTLVSQKGNDFCFHWVRMPELSRLVCWPSNNCSTMEQHWPPHLTWNHVNVIMPPWITLSSVFTWYLSGCDISTLLNWDRVLQLQLTLSACPYTFHTTCSSTVQANRANQFYYVMWHFVHNNWSVKIFEYTLYLVVLFLIEWVTGYFVLRSRMCLATVIKPKYKRNVPWHPSQDHQMSTIKLVTGYFGCLG